jgi:hypothetical protein
VVAGDRVDRRVVVLVRPEELVAVLVARPRRIEHVAGDHREGGALAGLQHARHDGVLGGVSLAGVAQQQEVEALPDVRPDPELGVRPAFALRGDPPLAHLS